MERNSLAAIHRVRGLKEEALWDWLREAAKHVEEMESLLLANFRLTRVQLDAFWTYVGHKGEGGHQETDERGTFWRGIAIDMDSRLRVAQAIGKGEKGVAAALMAQLKAWGNPESPPAIATDGRGGYREAILGTWVRYPSILAMVSRRPTSSLSRAGIISRW